jgi:HlyD family secretion protein
MKNKKKLILTISLVTFFVFLIVLFFIKPSKVNKYKIVKKKMVLSVYASGYIDSSDSVEIKSEVSGYIEKIFVKENDEVKKGQLLVTILNETIKENLKEVDAQIASLMDKLSPESDYKKELLNNIEIKKAILENTEKNFKRRKALYEEELISKEKFDDIKREYEIAKRDYERQINIYNDSIKNLKYQLESLKAKRQALKEEMNKHYIKSPINGKILRKFVNEGDYINHIQQNNSLFSVGNEKNLETVLLIDEEYIPMVKEGMKVFISLDPYPGEIFEGKIKVIESQSDRTSRTVKVRTDVNYGKPVFFNLTVEANIIIKEVEGLFIPENAYKDGYVEVLDRKGTKKVKVEVSKEKYNGFLLVNSGLKEGEEILIK